MTYPSRISAHLSFAEATTTDHRAYLVQQAHPPPEIVDNIGWYAAEEFEPARALLGPLHVNSLWRCADLNAAIGGSTSSAHMLGLAADVLPLTMEMRDAYLALQASSVPFDQLIWEFGRWIHLGGSRAHSPRRQCLMIFEPGKYLAFDRSDPRIAGSVGA